MIITATVTIEAPQDVAENFYDTVNRLIDEEETSGFYGDLVVQVQRGNDLFAPDEEEDEED